MLQTRRLLFLLIACGLASCALAQIGRTPISSNHSLDWDAAFPDRSRDKPVHFVARYTDSHGQTHRLEEWRTGITHLRRLTDDRIDLHADASSPAISGKPLDYSWQILDLASKIDHRISSQGMLRTGMFYSFYAMAHVLSRPAGLFQVHQVHDLPPMDWEGTSAPWIEVSASGQPSTRVAWLPNLGVPLRIMAQTGASWKLTFEIEQLDAQPFSAGIFAVNPTGFRVRNVDDIQAED